MTIFNEPPIRGQPPKRGQKVCSQSESPLFGGSTDCIIIVASLYNYYTYSL